MSCRFCLPDEHERFRVHEAADVVNVPVRIVAHRTVEQPQDVFHAEILPEHPVVLFPGQARVPHLDLRVQVTFLGRQQRPAAIDLDAAAFNDKISSLELRIEQRFLQ